VSFRVYATTDQRMPLSRIAEHARRAEFLGYDGLCVPDSVHDGLVAASVALQATRRLRVATSVLVAFPRSPMTVAMASWDLQELSGGRFELGLGSQVRGNLVGRYSTAWSAPAPRMREYVQSLRAIFSCWQDGTPLCFEGEHYRFTRMQPFFRPDPLPDPTLRILLGGIGPSMLALAGEVADGLVSHPTNSAPRYLREVVHPRLARGAARVGRDPDEVALLAGPLVVTGRDAAALAAERERTRELLTFLFSTPSYWPSLELFGWRERGERLHALSREGRWGELRGVVDDAMLAAFAPQATYAEIPDVLAEQYAGLTDWLCFPLPADAADDPLAGRAVARLRELGTRERT
jgi:probable F420-dependent oxidoreductase